MGQNQSYFTPESRVELLARPVGKCLLLNKPLCTLDPNESIHDAIKKFKRRNISSAPICTSSKEFVLVDIMDIACFLSNCFKTVGSKAFAADAKRMLSAACSQIPDYSTYNPTLSIKHSTPIREVIQRMRATRTHRMVLVNDSTEEVAHLVTQSGIVEFMLLNLDKLYPKPDATLLELGFFGTSPVLYCDESEITIEVFATMHKAPITGLPMRSQSQVAGILSMRDVRFLEQSTIADLLLPVKDFLKKHKPSFILGDLEMTLRDLLRCIAVNQIHHVFFVNEAGVPTHVITLTDILDFIVPELPPSVIPQPPAA